MPRVKFIRLFIVLVLLFLGLPFLLERHAQIKRNEKAKEVARKVMKMGVVPHLYNSNMLAINCSTIFVCVTVCWCVCDIKCHSHLSAVVVSTCI